VRFGRLRPSLGWRDAIEAVRRDYSQQSGNDDWAVCDELRIARVSLTKAGLVPGLFWLGCGGSQVLRGHPTIEAVVVANPHPSGT
jgi:hypothetical protein